jgi:hypothetical protein
VVPVGRVFPTGGAGAGVTMDLLVLFRSGWLKGESEPEARPAPHGVALANSVLVGAAAVRIIVPRRPVGLWWCRSGRLRWRRGG